MLAQFKETIMKKTPLLIAAVACSFATLAPLAVLASPDADTVNTQPQVVIKDSSIKSSIKAQFASDSYKGLSHIDVDVNHHGIVSLEGKVPSQEAADRAISIARATDGVREVKNQLKIKIDD
jgi:hyperosmotically inducible protein